MTKIYKIYNPFNDQDLLVIQAPIFSYLYFGEPQAFSRCEDYGIVFVEVLPIMDTLTFGLIT